MKKPTESVVLTELSLVFNLPQRVQTPLNLGGGIMLLPVCVSNSCGIPSLVKLGNIVPTTSELLNIANLSAEMVSRSLLITYSIKSTFSLC